MKTLHTACLLALALALAVAGATRAALAADPPARAGFAPLAHGEGQRMLEDAKTRRARAQALRSEADEEFRRSEAACYDKIMVSGCIREAKQERTRKTLEARQLDLGAERLQREVKLREYAQREAQNADKSPEREAAAAETASRHSEEAQTRAAEQVKHDAERERALLEAPARAAAEAAKRTQAADQAAQRRSAEAKRAAKRAESAARQRADLDRKAAELAKRRAQAEADAAAKAAAANTAGGSPPPR